MLQALPQKLSGFSPFGVTKMKKKLTDHLLGDPISKFNAPPSKHCEFKKLFQIGAHQQNTTWSYDHL